GRRWFSWSNRIKPFGRTTRLVFVKSTAAAPTGLDDSFWRGPKRARAARLNEECSTLLSARPPVALSFFSAGIDQTITRLFGSKYFLATRWTSAAVTDWR